MLPEYFINLIIIYNAVLWFLLVGYSRWSSGDVSVESASGCE